MPEEFDIY